MNEKNRPFVIHHMFDVWSNGCSVQDGTGNWCSAVCAPYPANIFDKIVACWWILTGRAHAFVWPEVGQLETCAGTMMHPKEKVRTEPDSER